MRILITGADQPLGELAVRALQGEHELKLTGTRASAPAGLEALPYTPADLREPDQVAPLVAGVEAIAHLAPHQPFATPDAAAEKLALDTSARGMFVLLREGLRAGVRRVVLASRLELMAGYPANDLIDETWKPLPEATAASLASFLAELTLREFVRAEAIVGVCLRLGDLGADPAGTSPADAATAIRKALAMELDGRKYRWWLYHICSTDRYSLGHASGPPLDFRRAKGPIG